MEVSHKYKVVGIWYVKHRLSESKKVIPIFIIVECNSEFERLLKIFTDKDQKNIDAKQMEI